MLFLRQSTASQEIILGPFLDDTDGKTAETALSIANTDIKIWKHGGTTEASKNSGGATHIASGRYYAVLDATDTDTLGQIEVNVHVAGALPVRRAYTVLSSQVYDSLIAASDALQVDAIQVSGTTQTARDLGASVLLSNGTGTGQVKLSGGYVAPNWGDVGNPTTTVGLSGTTVKTATDVETDTADIQSRIPAALVSGRIDASVGAMAANTVTASAIATGAIDADALAADAVAEIVAGFPTGVIDSGTAQDGGASTIRLRVGAPSTNLAAGGGAIVRLITGTGAGQQGWITSYDTGTKVATIRGAWLTNPDATTTYDVVYFPASTRTDLGTIKDQTVTCSAGVTVLASVGTAATSTAQTGDAFARIGANGAGLTALGDTRLANLDDTITSRMATYTQPTGFLAATFPTTVASTTNITAGTITTVTTLTNDPTGVTTLLSRLSSTRAGYLDNLSAGAVALEATAQAILADTGTDGVAVASSSKAGYSLAAGGLDSIAVETGVNVRQAASAILSATAGVLSGAGTGTVVIKAGNVPATTRITATTDSNGNRSAVTLSLPS